MSIRNPLLWLLLAVLLWAAAGMRWVLSRSSDQGEQYVMARIERGDIEESVSAVGILHPLQYVDVGTQVTGQVKTVHVQVGDAVKQGELVAEIDPTLFQSRVEAAKATLETLRAQLTERQAQQRLAKLQHARNKRLFAADAASEEALQQSAAAMEVSASQVSALQAQIQHTQAQLSGEEANLRYTKIYAPMTGTVVSLTARQGQTLVASQQAPTILRIANLKTMTVWAQVSEADEPKIRVGMPVYFNTLGQRQRRWRGTVRQILPTPETVNNVILYNVLFDVDNHDQALKVQMSTQVYFVLAKAESALVVPTSALELVAGKARHEPKPTAAEKGAKQPKERRFAVRLLTDGGVETRSVTVGIMNRASAQVLSGLAEGETVIVGAPAAHDDAGKRKGKSGAPPRFGRGWTPASR